ncbi:MAG: tetratricopeptide repeat protein [Candidatus Kryptonium sp.]
MSRLGEILRELQKEDKEKISAGVSKRRILTATLLISLFAISILVGYYMTKFVETLGIKTKSTEPFRSQLNHTVMTTPQSQNETLKPSGNQSIPEEQKTTTQPIVMAQNQTQRIDTNRTKTHIRSEQKSRKKITLLSKPPKIQKVRTETEDKLAKFDTISPKENVPLKEKGLLENILLSAEEARKKGDLEETLYFYSEYLKHREDPDVMNNMGSIYLLQGHYKKAEQIFAKALSMKYDPVYELNYFLSLIKQKNKDTPCKEILNKRYPPHLKEQVEHIKNLCN